MKNHIVAIFVHILLLIVANPTYTQNRSLIDDFTITITFAEPPVSMPLVEKAPLKYNKDFALILQMDDGNPAVHDQVMPFFKGQNGNPGLFFTEGNPQNNQPFKMDAVQYSFAANGTDIHDYVPGFLHWDNIINLWAGEFGIVNHGLTDPPQQDKELEALRNLSYTKRKTLSGTIPGGYDMNVFVVPNNDVAQIPFAKTRHLAVYHDGINSIENPQRVESLPAIQGVEVSRGSITNNLFQQVQTIAAQSGADNHYVATFFNHGFGGVDITFDQFKTQMNQIAAAFGKEGLNNIWSASSSEVWEYLRLKELVTVNTSLSENVLTISFQGDNIPEDFRYYALTITVEGASNIVDMVVTQPDGISTYLYNQNKALLNLKWNGRVVPELETFATNAVVIAEQQPVPVHALMAMDYVQMLPDGDVKETLRDRLCALSGITYEQGFCKAIAFLGPDQEVCYGDTIVLSAPDAVSYLWSTGATTQFINLIAEEPIEIWAQATDELGFTLSDTIFINVFQLPVVEIFPVQAIIDPGTEVVLTASGAETYVWSTGETTADITVNPMATTLFWVDGYNQNGCKARSEALVEVVYDINVDFAYDAVCIGDTTFLIAMIESNDPVEVIEWDIDSDGQFNDATGDTVAIVFDASGQHLVGMRVITQSGTITSIYNTVLVGGYPIVDFDFENTCFGQETMFYSNAAVDGGQINSFIWSMGDGNQYGGDTVAYQYDAQGTFEVSLIVVSNIGCADTLSKDVSIKPEPIIDLRLEDNTTIAEGQIVEMPRGGEIIFKVNSLYDSIFWVNTVVTETFRVINEGDFWVEIFLEGCGNQREFSVKETGTAPSAVDGIMNLFTPNADGFNDSWMIKDIDKLSPVRVAIYTRAGALVYQTSDYQNDWNGYYNGNPLPEGTYYYVIQDKNGTITKGPLSIIR